MDARPPAETASVRRLSTPNERHVVWKRVQQIGRKRAADAADVIAQMREEWDRARPAFQRPQSG